MSPIESWVLFGARGGGGGQKSSVTELVWGNGVNSLCRGGAAGRGGGAAKSLSLRFKPSCRGESVAFYPQSTYIGRDETWSVYLPTQLERTLQLYW
jgi:hypothetical protein